VFFMNELTGWALSIVATDGALILLLIAYFGSLGIPFPITPVIIAAGAFSRQGILDWRVALLACLCGAALADNSEYLLGRWAGTWLKRSFSQKMVWQRAQATINRQGGWAVLLTRFWLTPLAPAINVIAGSRYPYTRFLFFDLTGELLWVLLYGGLGYLFAGQWQLISQLVSSFSGLSLGLVVLAGAIYLLVRRKLEANRQLEASRRNQSERKSQVDRQPKAWLGLDAEGVWVKGLRGSLTVCGKWPWEFSVRRYSARRHSTFYITPYIQKLNHSWAYRSYDWCSSDAYTVIGDWKWNAHHR
jgi:membrane-associated protein